MPGISVSKISVNQQGGIGAGGVNWDAYWASPEGIVLKSKMVLWTNKDEVTDDYYINKIGDQDRAALTDDGIAGVIHPGRAINYDGSKSQYSRTLNNCPDNFKLFNNNITYFFRFKMDAAPDADSALIGISIVPGVYYTLIANDGKLESYVRNSVPTSIAVTSLSSVCDGLWHSAFIVIDTGGLLQLYIDNILQDSADISGYTFPDFTQRLFVGGMAGWYSGSKLMRDIRFWNTAITDETTRDNIHNSLYTENCIAWWLMESGVESDIHYIIDSVGTNNLFNYNFDETSLYEGGHSSLLNKYGYKVNYSTGDLIEGDGDFSESSLWTFSVLRWTISGGTANFLGAFDGSITNNRVVACSIGEILKISFTITAAAGTPKIAIVNSVGAPASPVYNCSLGSNELIFSSLKDVTAIIIRGYASGGSFSMDNFTIEKVYVGLIPPKIDKASPDKDTFNRDLIFKGQAKYNLIKIDTDTVKLPDYVGELIDADNLITINAWFTAGVANNIDHVNIGEYQEGRQYYNDEELFIIKADATLSETEDTVLKKKLNMVSATYTPYSLIDISLGETEGTTAEIYATVQAIIDDDPVVQQVMMNPVNITLDPTKKYVAQSWSDFFETDVLYIRPLATKYGFANTMNRQIVPMSLDPRNTKKYDRDKVKMIELSGCYDSQHGLFAHIGAASTHPLCDGRTIPSNDHLRVARADGTNAFGHDVNETVDTSITETIRYSWMRLSNDIGATAWKDLTDEDCVAFRRSLSMFGMEGDPQNQQEVLQSLDYLSNRYCGTTGYSVLNGDYVIRDPNVLNTGEDLSETNRIQGGIFQGAATTYNHEIWERLVEINYKYKVEFEGKINVDTYWTTPGGVGTESQFVEVGKLYPRYHDSIMTKLMTGVSKHFSSITNQERSFADVLRSYGYKSTCAFKGNGYSSPSADQLTRLQAQLIYKKNGCKKIDNIADGFTDNLRPWNALLSEAQIASLMTSEDVSKELYDLCYTLDDGVYDEPGMNFHAIINEMTKRIAWGIIPDMIDDSLNPNHASIVLQQESIFQFCKRAEITVIADEQAYQLIEMDIPDGYNYFPNHEFKTTARTILSSLNAPDYPDGWNGGVVSGDALYLSLAGTYFTRQYAIKPENFSFTFQAKGIGTLKIRKILNKDTYNNSYSSDFNEIKNIAINSVDYASFTESFQIEDAAMEVYDTPATPQEEAYQNYMKGYGNKICGIQIEIEISAGNEIYFKEPSITVS